jgi:hypothetical protein
VHLAEGDAHGRGYRAGSALAPFTAAAEATDGGRLFAERDAADDPRTVSAAILALMLPGLPVPAGAV